MFQHHGSPTALKIQEKCLLPATAVFHLGFRRGMAPPIAGAANHAQWAPALGIFSTHLPPSN